MSTVRQTLAVAAFAVVAPAVVALPGAAAEPSVPDANLRQAVLDLQVAQSVLDIDVANSVLPLQEESSSGGNITVRLSADVLFEFGKANLTDVARREIGEIAGRLTGTSGTVRVVGFTDSIGLDARNLTLSRRRAEAVKAGLAGRAGGIAFVGVGRGEASPVAPNTKDGKDYPEGRAKNRRVEITWSQG